MVNAAREQRSELKRLIAEGLMGRSPQQLFYELREAFKRNGDNLSATCFWTWIEGTAFPATRKRQLILADVVGGWAGKAIKQLPAPAFRGWRQRVMREEMHMGKATRSGSMHSRLFPHISVADGDGRRHMHPQITCAECGTQFDWPRNNSTEAEEVFRSKGWEVGKHAGHDFCPECIAKRKKVVKMSDHVKQQQPAEPVMSKEDGRILSRLIEDHWDEQMVRYQPGWSDTKIAEDSGKPVAWVKARRELDFGGVGEDPGIVEFLAQQLEIGTEMQVLGTQFEELSSSVSELTGQHAKVARMLEKYRDTHNALAGKVSRLKEAADKLGPFKASA